MSSDVYIDFNEGQPNEDLGNWIGHLGVMSYFGYDILDELRDICYDHKGKVTEEVVKLAMEACERFHDWCEEVDAGRKPPGSPYVWEPGRWKNLSPTKDDIFDLLTEHVGGTWYVRVD